MRGELCHYHVMKRITYCLHHEKNYILSTWAARQGNSGTRTIHIWGRAQCVNESFISLAFGGRALASLKVFHECSWWWWLLLDINRWSNRGEQLLRRFALILPASCQLFLHPYILHPESKCLKIICNNNNNNPQYSFSTVQNTYNKQIWNLRPCPRRKDHFILPHLHKTKNI